MLFLSVSALIAFWTVIQARRFAAPEGPGEGCYSVCLSKEIDKLHEEINSINKEGSFHCDDDSLKTVVKTTDENSDKLDAVLGLIQNVTKNPDDQILIGNLKKNLNDTMAKNEDLLLQNNRLESRLTNSSEQIELLENGTRELQNLLQQTKNKCNSTILDLNETLKNSNLIIKKLQNENKKIVIEKENLNNNLTISIKEKNNLKTAFENAKTVTKHLEKSLSDVTKQLKDCMKKQQEEKFKNTNLQKDLKTIQHEKNTLEEKMVDCKSHENVLQENLMEQEDLLNKKTTKIQDLSKLIEVLNASKSSLENENNKLKKELEDAKNNGIGNNDQKLKEENQKLEKQILDLQKEKNKNMKQINTLKNDLEILIKEKKTTRLRIIGSKFGATSEATFCEAEKAFSDDKYSSWTSIMEAPQMIWIQLSKASMVARFSFRCSIAPENGASKYEFVATNDAGCNEKSKWDVLFEDHSGQPFTSVEETKSANVCPRKDYKCYGFRIIDVGSKAVKWVIMSEVKLWIKV